MGDTPVKCSSCDVQAQVVLEGDTPKEVVCPRCGLSESYALMAAQRDALVPNLVSGELQSATDMCLPASLSYSII